MTAPQKPRAIAYIDGFNLYYLGLKGKPYKWLNLKSLLAYLYPELEVYRVKFFTARVGERPGARVPGNMLRQQAYLRALTSTPEVQVIFGNFQRSVKSMAAHPVPPSGLATLVEVVKTEEKGSDVNLATELLIDAFNNAFDQAIVVSNDSDLERAVKHVAQTMGKPVHLSAPAKHPSNSLKNAVAGNYREIRPVHLRSHQFPDPVPLPDGKSVTCPQAWRPGFIRPPRSAPPTTEVNARVKTVRGKYEAGEVAITVDGLGRVIQVAGQQLEVRRLPVQSTTPHHAPTPAPTPPPVAAAPSTATPPVVKKAPSGRKAPWWVHKKKKAQP